MKTIIMILLVACAGCYGEQTIAPEPQEVTECETDEDCALCFGPEVDCEIDLSTGLCIDGRMDCNACGGQWEYCCALGDGCGFIACVDGLCQPADRIPCQTNAACDEWCRGRDYAGGGVRCLGGDPRDYSGACDDCTCYYSL